MASVTVRSKLQSRFEASRAGAGRGVPNRIERLRQSHTGSTSQTHSSNRKPAIEDMWTDEHIAALKSEARDEVVAQYGDVERNLHKQLILGQVTRAQYANKINEMKRFRAAAKAGAGRSVAIAAQQGKQSLALAEAQMSKSSSGFSAMRGSKPTKPPTDRDIAAAWARNPDPDPAKGGGGFANFKGMKPGHWENAPAGVQQTLQREWAKRKQRNF